MLGIDIKEIPRTIRRRFLPHWPDFLAEQEALARIADVLHLGSGMTPVEGATTVDLNERANPDVVWDLNERPWPFKDNSFDGVIALNIVEHLDDFFGTMGEIHRVCRPGAVLSVLVPHFSSSAAHVDRTHKQLMSARSCDYFVAGTALERDYGFYVPWRFEMVRCLVELSSLWNRVPTAVWFARKCTPYWEDYACYLLRGAGVFWQLKVIK